MANTYPIKISEQATIIQTVLADWASDKGGTATVVSNLRDLWEQSSLQSQVPRILICFNGCTSRGAFSVANALHREDRNWIVAVTRGRGFNAVRGDSLNKQVQNADPFYDSVETVRDLLRGIQNISAEAPTIDYKGIKPMQLGQLVVDGYSIEFSTANDIVGFSSTTGQPIL